MAEAAYNPENPTGIYDPSQYVQNIRNYNGWQGSTTNRADSFTESLDPTKNAKLKPKYAENPKDQFGNPLPATAYEYIMQGLNKAKQNGNINKFTLRTIESGAKAYYALDPNYDISGSGILNNDRWFAKVLGQNATGTQKTNTQKTNTQSTNTQNTTTNTQNTNTNTQQPQQPVTTTGGSNPGAGGVGTTTTTTQTQQSQQPVDVTKGKTTSQPATKPYNNEWLLAVSSGSGSNSEGNMLPSNTQQTNAERVAEMGPGSATQDKARSEAIAAQKKEAEQAKQKKIEDIKKRINAGVANTNDYEYLYTLANEYSPNNETWAKKYISELLGGGGSHVDQIYKLGKDSITQRNQDSLNKSTGQASAADIGRRNATASATNSSTQSTPQHQQKQQADAMQNVSPELKSGDLRSRYNAAITIMNDKNASSYNKNYAAKLLKEAANQKAAASKGKTTAKQYLISSGLSATIADVVLSVK